MATNILISDNMRRSVKMIEKFIKIAKVHTITNTHTHTHREREREREDLPQFGLCFHSLLGVSMTILLRLRLAHWPVVVVVLMQFVRALNNFHTLFAILEGFQLPLLNCVQKAFNEITPQSQTVRILLC